MDHAKLDVRLTSRDGTNLAVITYNTAPASPVLYLGCGNKLTTHPCSGPGFRVSRRWTHVAGMCTVVSLAAVTLISLSCTCSPSDTKSPGIKWWAVPLLLHTLHPAHLHALSIAQFCLAAIITPIPLRLHDPHCLTARLESLKLHILFRRARLPTSAPTFLLQLTTPHLNLSPIVYISDIIHRVYFCPSFCHWHSLPPAKSSPVHYNESHTSVNALTGVTI